jgi:hypothetical protein
VGVRLPLTVAVDLDYNMYMAPSRLPNGLQCQSETYG